ncbi:Uu.00g085650.m01.CDS01 [Anthostomella pinea]|uniref:Uu.00g085650.m01.CDS01 n=1 Tax=Anthostomella pinea TaxID=933095 RepID=A0AAI8YHE8_9PEZI|nr:Uu.00g085650.m01.CDS01 [Anthostomella pinea]
MSDEIDDDRSLNKPRCVKPRPPATKRGMTETGSVTIPKNITPARLEKMFPALSHLVILSEVDFAGVSLLWNRPTPSSDDKLDLASIPRLPSFKKEEDDYLDLTSIPQAEQANEGQGSYPHPYRLRFATRREAHERRIAAERGELVVQSNDWLRFWKYFVAISKTHLCDLFTWGLCSDRAETYTTIHPSPSSYHTPSGKAVSPTLDKSYRPSWVARSPTIWQCLESNVFVFGGRLAKMMI